MATRISAMQAGVSNAAQAAILGANQYTYLFEDFVGNAIGNALGWSSATSGTAAASATTSTANADNRVGIWNIATGTDTTGRAGFQTSGSMARGAGGQIIFRCALRFSAVADGTDSYTLQFGLGDNSANGTQTDGVFFEHNQTSANWIINTSAATVQTNTTSSTAVVAAAFADYMIIVNALGTNAGFYINNVLIGSVTTNIPTAGNLFGLCFKIEKTLGTTSRTAQIDWCDFYKVFTTPR